MDSSERIASNILADRLKQLERSRIVTRQAYQHNPTRYEYVLTEKGEGLKPILEAIIVWRQENIFQAPGDSLASSHVKERHNP